MTSDPLRILADMVISKRVVGALREVGYDIRHVEEIGLARADDETIFARALSESRMVVTFDLDFGGISLRSGVRHGGLVLLRLRIPGNKSVLRRPRVALGACADDLRRGAVVTVTGHHHRVRRSPDQD